MYQLRPYQRDCVRATVEYFRKHTTPALLSLPTGAGKSLVIAELARIARGRVLVLTHVKELVEQNHAKYESYDLHAGIYSAGLGRRDTQHKVVFASVQSMANRLNEFDQHFTLLVIDECHRVSDNKSSQYRKTIEHLQQLNPEMRVLGLTATPYRLGQGWIYQYHTRGMVRSEQPCFFRDCIFELPIAYLLDEGFLSPAKIVDMAALGYDFSNLKPSQAGRYSEAEMNSVIAQSGRATPMIIEQVVEQAQTRMGVMIFAATVAHAQEILGYLPQGEAALIIGDTTSQERDQLINRFKQRELKYLVNVSVLTTGFDAPHVDLIAILRPTESISLYQQIVGRGLRLHSEKQDCLVLEYAGNNYDLHQNEVGAPKPDSDSELITVPCPACGFNNNFWGKLSDDGLLLEHYGRRCQGYLENDEGEREDCGYRFKAKYCDECGADNDIAARRCHLCDEVMVDPDKKLKEALKLKDALVVKVAEMRLSAEKNQYAKPQLKVSYIGDDGAEFSEFWQLNTKRQKQEFLQRFVPGHLVDHHRPYTATAPSKVVASEHRLRAPDLLIARKSGRFWRVRHKLFQLDQAELSEQVKEQLHLS